MVNKQRSIGVFDSGMGGLSVLKEMIKLLPYERYIYFADYMNAPYGNLSADNITYIVMKGVNYLLRRNVKMIVIACNTATTAAINTIRAAAAVPVIGLEPALLPALRLTKTKNVLMLATSATLKCKNYHSVYDGVNVKCCPCIDLASLIENNYHNDDMIYERVCAILRHYDDFDYDCVVLGCTHYILKKRLFIKAAKNNASIIDGNIPTAQNAARILSKNNILAKEGKKETEIILSGGDAQRLKLYKYVLNEADF